MGGGWWPDSHLELKTISPFIHFLSSHYFYQDKCRALKVGSTPEELFKCATAYQYAKPHADYDHILDFGKCHYGYSDDILCQKPVYRNRFFSRDLLYVGLLIHLLQIQI